MILLCHCSETEGGQEKKNAKMKTEKQHILYVVSTPVVTTAAINTPIITFRNKIFYNILMSFLKYI